VSAARSAGAPPRPLLLAPMRVEELLVRAGSRRAGLPGVEVERIGIGPVRATAARTRLSAALEPGRPVVLIGLGGGLRRGQRAGDVVVASELFALDGDETSAVPAAAELAALLSTGGRLRVSVGPLVSSARIVHGEDARAKAAARGALAVDMEAVWCAPLARRHPFAVVRVLIDVPGSELAALAKPAALLAASRSLLACSRRIAGWVPGASPLGTIEHVPEQKG